RRALEGVVGGLVVSCVVADSALGSSLVVDGSGAVEQDIVVADDVPGLLASIRTLPEGATVRTANGYAYEVLPLSADPFDEHTAPEGFQLQTAGGSKLRVRLSDSVTPEMLNGDLHMAAACAAVFKVTLMTGRIDYEITTAFQ